MVIKFGKHPSLRKLMYYQLIPQSTEEYCVRQNHRDKLISNHLVKKEEVVPQVFETLEHH